MLENRPIAKKTLYGTGAFAFVFAAAMGGTAFMITGGLGGDHSAPADAPAYQIASTDAWAGLTPALERRPERATIVPASLPASAPIEQPDAASEVTVLGAAAPVQDSSGLPGGLRSAPAAPLRKAKSDGL